MSLFGMEKSDLDGLMQFYSDMLKVLIKWMSFIYLHLINLTNLKLSMYVTAIFILEKLMKLLKSFFNINIVVF